MRLSVSDSNYSSHDFVDLDTYENELRKNGIVVLKGLFDDDYIDMLTKEFDVKWKDVNQR